MVPELADQFEPVAGGPFLGGLAREGGDDDAPGLGGPMAQGGGDEVGGIDGAGDGPFGGEALREAGGLVAGAEGVAVMEQEIVFPGEAGAAAGPGEEEPELAPGIVAGGGQFDAVIVGGFRFSGAEVPGGAEALGDRAAALGMAGMGDGLDGREPGEEAAPFPVRRIGKDAEGIAPEAAGQLPEKGEGEGEVAEVVGFDEEDFQRGGDSETEPNRDGGEFNPVFLSCADCAESASIYIPSLAT